MANFYSRSAVAVRQRAARSLDPFLERSSPDPADLDNLGFARTASGLATNGSGATCPELRQQLAQSRYAERTKLHGKNSSRAVDFLQQAEHDENLCGYRLVDDQFLTIGGKRSSRSHRA